MRVSVEPSARNPEGLTTSDLAEIYCAHRDLIPGLDATNSASSKMIASYISKSMGEKIIASDVVSITVDPRKKAKAADGLGARLLGGSDEVAEHATALNDGKKKVISIDALIDRARPAATLAPRAGGAGRGYGTMGGAGAADYSRR